MKKIMLLIAITCIFFGVIHAQQITVTSPTGLKAWCIGSEYVITWDRVGTMQNYVFINLKHQGDTASGIPAALEITTSTPNPVGHNGITWLIPNTVAPGKYFIRVRTLDTNVYGDSATFSIVPPLVFNPDDRPVLGHLVLLPDLIICLNWYGMEPYIYGNQRIKVRVRNIGKANSTPTLFKIYVEGHGTLTLLAPWLPPNAEYNWSQLFKWKTCGHKTVRATVDPDGQLAESNESNNVVESSIKVSCGETGYLLEMVNCSDPKQHY